jgi:Zinc finger, C3HC4 type (RING finger)
MDSQYSYYASANHESEESGTLDFGFLAGSTNSYTTTVQNVLTRQGSEIRSNVDVLMQPLHQVARKRVRELIVKHNNQLLQFLVPDSKKTSEIKTAEDIFAKFGRDIPLNERISTQISQELNVDCSMNAVMEELDAAMNKACTATSPSLLLVQQVKWAFQQYKIVGDEVMRLEALLIQKTGVLDKLAERQNLVLNLKTNDALPALLDAFADYMGKIFEESNFELTYKELATTYKKWNVLRDIISLHQSVSTDTHEPLCAICLAEPVTHTVAPCGHTFCTGCVRRLNITCYLCRGSVRERIKLFFT